MPACIHYVKLNRLCFLQLKYASNREEKYCNSKYKIYDLFVLFIIIIIKMSTCFFLSRSTAMTRYQPSTTLARSLTNLVNFSFATATFSSSVLIVFVFACSLFQSSNSASSLSAYSVRRILMDLLYSSLHKFNRSIFYLRNITQALMIL